MPDFDNPSISSESTVVPVRISYEYCRLSQDLQARLSAIQETSRVAKMFLALNQRVSTCIPDLDGNINYFGISIDDPTKISYLNFSRIRTAFANNQAERLWEDKNFRYHSSAGKVVRKLFESILLEGQPDLNTINHVIKSELVDREDFDTEPSTFKNFAELFTETDYDQFNNLFRIEGFRQGDGGEVIYVRGHWIQELYLEKNYASTSGTLGNSCMRYSRTNKFLEIYSKNPSVCKLAVILNQDGKVQARALVWTVDGVDYYDRIYATSDLIQDRMKAFFLVQGMDTCYSGYSGYKQIKLRADYNNKDFDKRVLLSFESYPYMDSLKYLDEDRTILGNSEFCINYGNYLILNSTDGNYESTSSSNEVECDCCHRTVHEDDTIYIDFRRDEHYNYTVCNDCGGWSEHHNAYVTIENCVTIDDEYVLEEDAIQDYQGDWILRSKATELIDGRYASDDDDNLTEYDNGNYFIMGDSTYEFVEYDSLYYQPEECCETKDGIMVPTELTIEVDGEVWLKSDYEEYQNLNLL